MDRAYPYIYFSYESLVDTTVAVECHGLAIVEVFVVWVIVRTPVTNVGCPWDVLLEPCIDKRRKTRILASGGDVGGQEV